MKKYIVNRIKDNIEEKKQEWARNYVAKQFQLTLTSVEAKKQVESANHNMKMIESTIEFLKALLKTETKKED
jgi:hypothetical protein